MKLFTRNSTAGFTLVELILYVGLSTIVLGGVIRFSLILIDLRAKAVEMQRINRSVSLLGERILYEIRNAVSVTTVGAQSLTLVPYESARNSMVIDLRSGRIYLGQGTSGSCPIADPCPLSDAAVVISNLQFSDISSGARTMISVSFDIQSTTAKSQWGHQASFRSAAQIRNL